MDDFDDLIRALRWILEPEATSGADPVRWRLDVLDRDGFDATLDPAGDSFTIGVHRSVWPLLNIFCSMGIDWSAGDELPRYCRTDYSVDKWRVLIRAIADDGRELDSVAHDLAALRGASRALKSVRIPFFLRHPTQSVAAAAAVYGYLWLIAHEGAHAWRRHYQLRNLALREHIQAQSASLAGLELWRTCEHVADATATEFVSACVFDCVASGYSAALAYAGGFGVTTSVLLLSPTRHGLWEEKAHHDPPWTRLHFIEDGRRAGYWKIVRSRYPKYVELLRKVGVHRLLNRPDLLPPAEFENACERAHIAFHRGQLHALTFAQAIGEVNREHTITNASLFTLGEAREWKDFQHMVLETHPVDDRREATRDLNQQLPSDPRFEGSPPFGQEPLLKTAYLAVQFNPVPAPAATPKPIVGTGPGSSIKPRHKRRGSKRPSVSPRAANRPREVRRSRRGKR